MRKSFTHFDSDGKATMVDVSDKPETHRIARACGTIRMLPATFRRVQTGTAQKGDVLGIARIAAIQASKKTSDLVPLCHPLQLSRVLVDFDLNRKNSCISLIATVSATGRTGVEMEALAAVSIGLLTIYDMCKALDRGMTIESIFLVEKSGGKSGLFRHPRADMR